MKVIDLLTEYKNKYYKPVPRKPTVRAKKTLWHNNYENWARDIKSRFPDANAYYDEENEEIIAACPEGKEAYGKWSKKKKGFPGVSFHKPRSVATVSKYLKNLRQVKDDVKPKNK